jgi:hypothetical protein
MQSWNGCGGGFASELAACGCPTLSPKTTLVYDVFICCFEFIEKLLLLLVMLLRKK